MSPTTATISDSAAQITVICTRRLSTAYTPVRTATLKTIADIHTRRKMMAAIAIMITTTGTMEVSLSLPGTISGGTIKRVMMMMATTVTQNAMTMIEATL